MRTIREEYDKNGVQTLHEETDDKDSDQIALRDTINGAINQLQVIVDAANMTPEQNVAATQKNSQILIKLLRYFKKEILR